MMPSRNIYWRSIPAGSKVTDAGNCFLVQLPGGEKGVAYWTGTEAAEAPRALAKASRHATKVRGKNKR